MVDSGCGDYDHIFNTVSLRGVINFELNVRCLKEGVHSGSNGGIAADTFNICRILLDRIDNAKTGMLLPELFAPMNDKRK